MKNIIYAIAIIFLANSFVLVENTGTIRGRVIDKQSRESIIFCSVSLFQNDKLINQTQTDFDGNFSFGGLAKGKYQLRTNYTGYITDSLVNIQEVDVYKIYTIELKDKANYDEHKVKSFKTFVEKRDAMESSYHYYEQRAYYKYHDYVPKLFAKLKGKVKDNKSHESLIGANVTLFQNDTTVSKTITNLDGSFQFDELESGKYSITVSYTGYYPVDKTEVLIKHNDIPTPEFNLIANEILDEVTIVGYKVPLIEADNTTMGATITREEISSIPTKNIAEITGRLTGVARSKKKIKAEDSYDFSKGVPEVRLDKMSPERDRRTSTAPDMEYAKTIELPEAGQLTAAEWNDLNNWDDWNELIADGEYATMTEYWGLEYKDRYNVFMTNQNNLPLVNCTVKLISDREEIIWEAKTDNKGRAELWGQLESDSAFKIVAEYAREAITIENPKEAKQGSNYINLPIACKSKEGLDIMFVVDATGSMGDEINYLRSELSNVIETVKTQSKNKGTLRIGSIFYKDKSDDYLTKETPLDENIENTIDFIKTKVANGGGDFPEAVDAGLELALQQDWNMDALNRVIFLLLDAPPHHDAKTLRKINTQIAKAAQLGIKIIPITASGINRETEFLMKQMSILTNGTYVFITDDSGIGNPHLKPIIPDYEVEKLNDLLVRLITNYAEVYNCSSAFNEVASTEINIYPNPAQTKVTIELDQELDKLVLYTSTGKVLETLVDLAKGQHNLDVSNYPAGMYAIKFLKNGKLMDSKTLMVVN